MAFGNPALAGKIGNPPSPPFRKGGLGGDLNAYFPGKRREQKEGGTRGLKGAIGSFVSRQKMIPAEEGFIL
jgi:hypothetical protein